MLIIDGYNLLRTVEKIQDGDESITDILLCRMLAAYLQQIGQSGQIIFDGIGPPEKSGFENIANLEVVFSGRITDADTVIKDKIAANSAPKRLVVVSSDRSLRTTAKRRKATSLKVEQFWQDVVTCLSREKRPPTEPSAKRNGLSQSETDQWLKTFGLKDDC